MEPTRYSRAWRAWAHVRLGPLEFQIMELVWASKECTVRELVQRLPENRPYTTVMTTVDRLFFKGLLNRKKIQGRFVYWPRLDPEDLEEMLDKDVVAYFQSRPEHSRESILQSLIQSIKRDDPSLYERLEKILMPTAGVELAPPILSQSTQSTEAIVKISSTPSGADIEFDGAFAGNTPSILRVARGEHVVKLRKRSYKAWHRALKAHSGTISLHAELEEED